jgi:hypothetical protein
METVKVDMQKLQLLNERIAQTIDALNQVRMSIHGFQHGTPSWGMNHGYVPYASPNPWPYGLVQFTPPYSHQPFTPSFYPQYSQSLHHGWSVPSYPTAPYPNGLGQTTWEPRVI